MNNSLLGKETLLSVFDLFWLIIRMLKYGVRRLSDGFTNWNFFWASKAEIFISRMFEIEYIASLMSPLSKIMGLIRIFWSKDRILPR